MPEGLLGWGTQESTPAGSQGQRQGLVLAAGGMGLHGGLLDPHQAGCGSSPDPSVPVIRGHGILLVDFLLHFLLQFFLFP